MMTEEQKMLAGKIYDPTDAELSRKRRRAHRLSQDYNMTYDDEREKRAEILRELLPDMGENGTLQGPVQFDYGIFTHIGRNFYANFNFTVLDCCPVTIGDNVFFGPNCAVMTPLHPLLPLERNQKPHADGSMYDDEYAAPITIGDDCWIASNVVICGGVTIGSGCVIGAGSIVTKDIPAGMLAAGNPCRVIRKITEEDSIFRKPELW